MKNCPQERTLREVVLLPTKQRSVVLVCLLREGTGPKSFGYKAYISLYVVPSRKEQNRVNKITIHNNENPYFLY